jgi:cytidylate kinase
MQARDARDAERAVAPLKPAADAMLLDTTHMGIEAAVEAVLQHFRAKSS